MIDIGKAGRKGKFQEWLTPDGLIVLEGLARDGLTDEQISQKIGIGTTTFYRWQEQFREIRDAIKKGKAPVDVQVENALLKRALGYEYEETITEMEEVSGGKPKKHIRKVTKHMPPDTTAQIFWLKNRRPDRWRDKIENVQTVGNELLESLMRLERSAGHD